MYVTTRNFMQFLVEYTKSLNTTIVLLRTIGPDNVSDADKANAIYSAYYMNMQSENPKIFDTMLYNEFTFVEFSDEESAWEFCRDNFPLNRTIDDDYFVQYVIYSNGNYVRGNDGNTGLREPPPEPV
jgi:glucan biosynthesis protein